MIGEGAGSEVHGGDADDDDGDDDNETKALEAQMKRRKASVIGQSPSWSAHLSPSLVPWSELHSVSSAAIVWPRLQAFGAGASFSSVAYSQAGMTRPYSGVCSLRIDRILSRRRHQREIVGNIRCDRPPGGAGTSCGAPSMRFAVGEFRLERVTIGGGRAPAASAADERCELQLLGDEACLLNEGEGQLEEDECVQRRSNPGSRSALLMRSVQWRCWP